MSGMRKYAQKDILYKINKLERALNPVEKEQFLADIAEKRLGVQIGYRDYNIGDTITNDSGSIIGVCTGFRHNNTCEILK